MGLGGLANVWHSIVRSLSGLWNRLLDIFENPRRRNSTMFVVSIIGHILLLAYLAVPRPPTFHYRLPEPSPPDIVVEMIPPPPIEPPRPPEPQPTPTPAPTQQPRWVTEEDVRRAQQAAAAAPQPPQAQPTPTPTATPPAPIAPPTPTPPRPQPQPTPNAPPRPVQPAAPAPTPPSPAPPAPPSPPAPPAPPEVHATIIPQTQAPVTASTPNAIHRAPVAAPNSPIQAFHAPSNLFSPGAPAPAAAPGASAPGTSGRPSGGAPAGAAGRGASALPFGSMPGGGNGFNSGLLACRDPDFYHLDQAARQRCIERLGNGANRVAPADAIAAARARLDAQAATLRAQRAYRNATPSGAVGSASDVPSSGGMSNNPTGGPPEPAANPAGPPPPTRGRDLPGQFTRPAEVGPGTGQ